MRIAYGAFRQIRLIAARVRVTPESRRRNRPPIELTIESNAKVDGSIRTEKIVIAGELNGNIDAASPVELMPRGAL